MVQRSGGRDSVQNTDSMNGEEEDDKEDSNESTSLLRGEQVRNYKTSLYYMLKMPSVLPPQF